MKFKMYFEDQNNLRVIIPYEAKTIENARAKAAAYCEKQNKTGPGYGWAFRVDVILDKEKLVKKYAARLKGDMSKEEVSDAIDSIEDAVNFS